MNRKLLFFVNPNAGHAEIRNSLMDVVQVFSLGGYDVTVYPTQGPKDLTRKLVQCGADYDLVVCTGGDGTLNEAVSGLMQLEDRPLLGYIPGGTTNDVASSLKLSHDPVQAAKDIVNGKPFAMDVSSFCGDRWFFYVAAFGLFTNVPYETPQADKRIFGKLAYVLNGAKELGNIRSVRAEYTIDGVTEELRLVDGIVCSSTSVGGFRPPKETQGVALDDGLAEMILVREIRNLADFNAAAANLLRGDFQADSFVWRQTDHVRFRFDEPVPWTLDGEFGGEEQDAEIRVYRQAIRILVPQ